MSAQGAINSIIGSAGSGILGVTHTISQAEIAKGAKIQQQEQARREEAEAAAIAEEEKKKASYGAELDKIFKEESATNPKILSDVKYLNKAMDIMESKRATMLLQREQTRQFRDRFAPESKEYKGIEELGQERKTKNFEDFRAELRALGKAGRPRKGGM